MGTLSPIHWIIILLVIVLLFGAKKIPELAKGLGQGIKEFKKASSETTKELSEAEKPNASKPDSEAKKEG
jgi:sec-independent protein translocase protein TatA